MRGVRRRALQEELSCPQSEHSQALPELIVLGDRRSLVAINEPWERDKSSIHGGFFPLGLGHRGVARGACDLGPSR